MNIPILTSHDSGLPPIGFVEAVDGELHVRFNEDMKITRDMAFQIFGDAGILILEATEEDGEMLIRRGRIVEWSLAPQASVPRSQSGWTRTSDRMPDALEVADGYFWCWDETMPDDQPCLLESWTSRDGVTIGFCHEACGIVSGVTNWMPAVPPEPPEVGR